MKKYKSPYAPIARAIGMDEMVPLMRESFAANGCAILPERGVSMLPFLKEGRDSVVLAEVAGALKKHDIVLYQRADGSYVLHRIASVGESYTCIGDAQFVFEKGIAPSRIIARVTAIRRHGRLIRAENFVYRLCVWLWSITRPMRHFMKRAVRKLRRMLLKKK